MMKPPGRFTEMAAQATSIDALKSAAVAWLVADRAAVVVDVVAARGSVPRPVGTRMLVAADGIAGSIGGGHLEWQAMAHARRWLQGHGAVDRDPAGPAGLQLALGASLGQCCGGAVGLAFTPLSADALAAWPDAAPRCHLQLHGAGHVGQAIVRLLAGLDVALDWVDERDALTLQVDDDAHGRLRRVEPADDAVADAPPGARILVMTHRHDLDLRIVDAALRRDDLGFLGLIGSATKRRRFAERLREMGHVADTVERIVCPIGVPDIAGKAPEVIAVSVVAQLLQTAPARRDDVG